VYCRAERYPHIGVPFKTKNLLACLEIHMWVPRVMLFSFRPFCDTTHSKCVYLNWRHKRVEVRHDVWGPSLPVKLHPGCWTWSFPTFWTSSTRSVGFSEMLNPFPADYASTHHTRNYSWKSILMYVNVLWLLVGVPSFFKFAMVSGWFFEYWFLYKYRPYKILSYSKEGRC